MAKTWRKTPVQGVKYSDRKKDFASEQPVKTASTRAKPMNKRIPRPDKVM